MLSKEEYIKQYYKNLSDDDILNRADEYNYNIYYNDGTFWEMFKTKQDVAKAIANANDGFNINHRYFTFDGYLNSSDDIKELVDVDDLFLEEANAAYEEYQQDQQEELEM